MHLLIVATLFAIGTLAPLLCAAATQDNVQPSSPNQIQSYETGYSLMTSCNNPQQRAYCVGFIVGVVRPSGKYAGSGRLAFRKVNYAGLLKSQVAAAAVKYLT